MPSPCAAEPKSAISPRPLGIFLAVARTGQLTLSAQTLHLTQCATSLVITERGRVLLAETPELLARVQALPELLNGQGKVLRGELHVAASSTVCR